jgi:hypothetical protein
MAGIIRCEFDTVDHAFLMEVNDFDFRDAIRQITVIVDLIVDTDVGDTKKITQHHLHDCFRGVCHENLALKICFFCKMRQSSNVIDVKVRDQKQINIFSFYRIEKWQRSMARISLVRRHSSVKTHSKQPTYRVYTAIQHNRFALELQNNTRATHFISRTQWHNAHDMSFIHRFCVTLALARHDRWTV